MNAFKGLWLGAVEMGSVEVVLVFHHTHTHTSSCCEGPTPLPCCDGFSMEFPTLVWNGFWKDLEVVMERL